MSEPNWANIILQFFRGNAFHRDSDTLEQVEYEVVKN